MSGPASHDQFPAANVEHTVATLSEEQLSSIGEATQNPFSFIDIRVADGDTLISQCNKNYDYLNQRGVSMNQFIGVVRDAFDTELPDSIGYTPQQDGTLLSKMLLREIVADQVTGAQSQRTRFTVNIPSKSMINVSNTQVAALEYGIFTKPAWKHYGSFAEEWLTVLGRTDFGRELFARHGIGDAAPAQPIAIMPEQTVATESTEHDTTGRPPQKGWMRVLRRK